MSTTKTIVKDAECDGWPKTWEKCKDDDQRANRIRVRIAQYREYQDDEDQVDASEAFTFADQAAHQYLPWCLKRIEELEKIAWKYWLLKNKAKRQTRRRR